MWRSAAIGFLIASGLVQAQENKGPVACGELANAFGPFDYRSASEEDRRLVNGAHFTEQVETLKSGKTTNWPGGDIDYTLRAFPNHPRALLAMMNLSFKEKRLKPNSAHWPVECYFDRAERFRGEVDASHTKRFVPVRKPIPEARFRAADGRCQVDAHGTFTSSADSMG